MDKDEVWAKNNPFIVRIQIVSPDGRVRSANDYGFTSDHDATEAAFAACELVAEEENNAKTSGS